MFLWKRKVPNDRGFFCVAYDFCLAHIYGFNIILIKYMAKLIPLKFFKKILSAMIQERHHRCIEQYA